MKILSLGLGVQSTALYYMSSMGELPRVDYAIFADTGREKTKTLEYLHFLQSWRMQHNGIPIIHAQKRNLYEDLLNARNSTGKRFASIPAYTKNADGSVGMLLRQCTGEYKIWGVDQVIRELYGLAPKKRTPPTEVWKGITLDELERMSIPAESWKGQVYPFVGYHLTKKDAFFLKWTKKMTRTDVINWYLKNHLPIPPKSSCTFCPYQSDAAWLFMKEHEQEDWASAVLVDRAIRNSTKKGINNPVYLHESCAPLESVSFKKNENDLWRGECTGHCHT